MPTTATTLAHPISPTEVELLAGLICGYRPSWDPALVKYILNDCREVDSADLAIAAIRYAADSRYDTPKGIKWKGPHWRDLNTTPLTVTISNQRCTTCGKPEQKCITERPGRDDDHRYSPA